jgi:pilus assembly protein CpaB
MKLQYVGLLGVGLIAAVCAMVLIAFTKNSAKPVSDTVDVIVTTREVPAMTKVTADLCEVKKTAKGQAPNGSIPDPTGVIGQVTVVPMVAGQAYTQACFAPEGSGFHLAATLPQGKRAVTVALADYSVLEGLLYPGSTVDVIASFDMRSKGESRGGIISKTLLHGIQVLAVENKTVVSSNTVSEQAKMSGNENRRKVTLLVDPSQAEILQLATVHGTISLAMRKPNDKTEASDHITRLADLGLPPEFLDEPTEKPAPAPVAAVKPAEQPKAEAAAAEPPKEEPKPARAEPASNPGWTTTILRGGQPTTKTFPIPEDQRNHKH